MTEPTPDPPDLLIDGVLSAAPPVLPTGAELSAAVALEVMGWELWDGDRRDMPHRTVFVQNKFQMVVWNWSEKFKCGSFCPWHPHEDLNQSFDVLRKAFGDSWVVNSIEGNQYYGRILAGDEGKCATAADPGTAICQGALLAVRSRA